MTIGSKMFESDKNMLEAIDRLIQTGKVKHYQDVIKILGWKDRNRLNRIRTQRNPDQGHHFSAEDIRILCRRFRLNANKILGVR